MSRSRTEVILASVFAVMFIQLLIMVLNLSPIVDWESNVLILLGLSPRTGRIIFIVFFFLVFPFVLKHFNENEKEKIPEKKVIEKKSEGKTSKLVLFIWVLIWATVMFFVFIYPNFPDAWKNPSNSLRLTGMFLLFSGFIYFFGAVTNKKKEASGSLFFLICLSAFYFVVFLVRTFIWV